MKVDNFGAGPCILPPSVFEQASQAVLDFNDSGLSILEISHRSKGFTDVIEEAQATILELTGLKDKGYQALFLQGGASTQFLMVAYNLLQNKAAYLNTGRWSSNAIKEAKLFGEVIEVASSADQNFNYIPKNYPIPADVDYFHCTSNNTIYGTQMKEFPEVKVPLICDMSSDILSREMDFSKFDLIYAGAQKNMGTSGATLVLVKEDILGKVQRQIPTMMDYKVHIAKDSLFNTPSVFSIYVSMLTLRWLKELGGIKAIEKLNQEKADLLYGEIDRNPAFEGIVAKEDRSLMNVVFKLTDPSREAAFNKLWQESDIVGIKGHRSVGGYRASLYNALPIDSVKNLVEIMTWFERQS